MSSLETEAQMKRLVDVLSVAGEDFKRWVNLQVANREESLPVCERDKSTRRLAAEQQAWQEGYDDAMSFIQEKRDQAQPIAWALDKGDGSVPRVPYPGSYGVGSRYAAERVIKVNPQLGYKAVPLYRMEDL